jgi:hypothetical protein
MNCPGCSGKNTAVRRTVSVGVATVRYRQCTACNGSWISDEIIREGSYVPSLVTTNRTALTLIRSDPDQITKVLDHPPAAATNSAEEITQTEYSPLFQDAWKAYGRKESKRNAWASWRLLSKKLPGGEESLHQLITTAINGWQGTKFAADNWKYAPYFERYIKDCRWEDEPETTGINRTPIAAGVDPQLKDYYDRMANKWSK